MKKAFSVICFIISISSFGNNLDSLVHEKLKSINQLPLVKKGKTNWNFKNLENTTKDIDTTIHCGDSAYWELIKMQKGIIPILINKITDRSKTNIPIPCSKDSLTIGGLAFLILEQIINIPNAQVTQMQWCVVRSDCGFNSTSGFISYVQSNPVKFQNQLKKWYLEMGSKIEIIQQNEYSECFINY
jgi:hypothetical protein|tara:strand:+ start:254 stop:811 length:558 start_codon:yes stop_codon:yes gene_type:complete